jgi:hypothetical protein
LKRALDSNSDPYTYFIDSNRYNDEILDLLEQYDRKAFKEYCFIEGGLDKIIGMISDSMNIDKIQACLLLFQDCLIQREDINKNEAVFGELYRDGIEVMEYLFDVLNYIAGYHEKQISQDALRDTDSPMPMYPHVVLALESVQCFFEMFDAEKRPENYLHRIMLRLYVISYLI